MPERDGHGIGKLFRHFPEEAATIEAEDAAPDTIEMDRNDRSRPSFHDPFESTPEGQQRSRTGNLAFREDADKFSLVDGRARHREGLAKSPAGLHEKKSG